MREPVRRVIATCLQTVLLDEPWQDFGFRKRPRYAAIIGKLRPSWRVALEKAVLTQMLSATTAAHIVAGVVGPEDIEEIITFYTATPELVHAMGYRTRDEARRHLAESVEQYAETPVEQWPSIFASRIGLSAIPDSSTGARVLVGCVRFCQNVQGMIDLLRFSELQRPTHELEHDATNWSDVDTDIATNQIIELAQAVHRVLDQYIEVHNDIFGTSIFRTLRQMLPIPGFFESIPFAQHAETLGRLRAELAHLRGVGRQMTESMSAESPKTRFLVMLGQYCDALFDTVSRLEQICLRLAAKAKGEPSLTWEEYQRSLKEYERSVEGYRRLGGELNLAFCSLKSSPPCSPSDSRQGRTPGNK